VLHLKYLRFPLLLLSVEIVVFFFTFLKMNYMETLNWKTSGINCNGCADRLEKVLSGKAGVLSARVSFLDKHAFLEYDSTAISSYQIKDAVEKPGFEIVTA